jgi:hypothetical protein
MLIYSRKLSLRGDTSFGLKPFGRLTFGQHIVWPDMMTEFLASQSQLTPPLITLRSSCPNTLAYFATQPVAKEKTFFQSGWNKYGDKIIWSVLIYSRKQSFRVWHLFVQKHLAKWHLANTVFGQTQWLNSQWANHNWLQPYLYCPQRSSRDKHSSLFYHTDSNKRRKVILIRLKQVQW